MAVLAERPVLSEEVLDRQLAELQFSAASSHVPLPESEIYGRSLSTIRKFGATMVANTLQTAIERPEAAQARVEFFTSVEEGFGTDMELGGGLEVRDFDVRPTINGRVMAKDLKTAISAMTEAGLKCAVETTKKDERFKPQLTRSVWDHENALTVDKMARGETGYNTRIAISPFPEEAAAQSGDAYWRKIGYVPHLRRGFVQLYHVVGNEVISGSLSFDGSNKQQLREIFKRFGIQIPEDEITDNWLKYAITGNFSTDEAMDVATAIADDAGDARYKKNTNTVDVTKQYRPIMERAFNESYVHICESLVRQKQTDGVRKLILRLADNAHHFNEHYSSALYRMRADGEGFSEVDSIILHELLVYSTIEMMRALHLKKVDQYDRPGVSGSGDAQLMYDQLHSADTSAFQSMLSGFGADGARNNRVYSACGNEIQAGGRNPQEASPQAAFGGSDQKELSSKKVMSCPYCTAKVFDDPCAIVLSCWDCNALVVSGKVISIGDGGSKGRAARKAEEARLREEQKQAAKLAAQVDDVFAEKGLELYENSSQPTSNASIQQPAPVADEQTGQTMAQQVDGVFAELKLDFPESEQAAYWQLDKQQLGQLAMARL